MNLFEPERYFSSVACISVEQDLLAAGRRHVLLDIDNTIRARNTKSVPTAVRNWLSTAHGAGIRFCFITNNWHSDVHDLAMRMGIPIVAKACKPLPFAYTKALRVVEGSKHDTVMVGDQLLTDVVGAHIAGLPAWLVLPLCEVDIRNIIPLRAWEKALLGTRQPEGAHMQILQTNEEKA